MHILETPQHVVVWDPEGDYWEGAVVESSVAARLGNRGVITLPVVPDHFKWSGVAGWAKRAWGAGLPLDSLVPAMAAPLTLYCHPEARGLTWAARLVPDVRADGQGPARRRAGEGMIRFTSDTGQRTVGKGQYSEVEERAVLVRDFHEPDNNGGWTIRGRGHVSIGSEGHYGYSLYGTAPGLRVVWVAASLVPMRIG